METSQKLKNLFEEKEFKYRELNIQEDDQKDISKIYTIGFKSDKYNYRYTISFVVFDDKDEIIILVYDLYKIDKDKKNKNFYELINSFNVATFYGKVFFSDGKDLNKIGITYTHTIQIDKNQDMQDILKYIKVTRSQVKFIIKTLRENGFNDEEKL